MKEKCPEMYRQIDLNEWEEFGEGAESIAYNSRNDETKMLKLFKAGQLQSAALNEYNRNIIARKIGIRTPEAYEIVQYGDRLGIVFERIRNKQSLSRIIQNDPDKLEDCARLHARMLRTVHSKESTELPDTGEDAARVFEYIKRSGILNQNQLEVLKSCSRKTDERHVIVVDTQISNIIVSGDEITEENAFFIDLGRLSAGDIAKDLAMLLCMGSGVFPEEAVARFMRLTEQQAKIYWYHFIREYLNTDKEEIISEYEKRAAPYVAEIYIGAAMLAPEYIDRSTIVKLFGE